MRKGDGESQFQNFAKDDAASTRWSMIHRAREGSKADIDKLCHIYFLPIRRFIDSWKKAHMTPDRLDELANGFFAKFLEKDLKRVVREESFRGFLKTACRAYYINWVEAEMARQPKGGRKLQSMDTEEGTVDVPMPEQEFSSRFDESVASTLLEESQERLKATLIESGKEVYWKIFEGRKGDPPVPYKKLSEELGPSVFDVRNHLTAARKLWRKIIREMAEERFEDPEAELRQLGILKYL